MTASPAPIRLTDLTDCGGCAAKLGADLLADALAGLGADARPELVVGLDPADDAAAYLVAPTSRARGRQLVPSGTVRAP